MNITSIKYFEGNNIKRRKKIMRIIFNQLLPEEASKLAELYIHLCAAVGMREEIVDLEVKGEEVYLWISYSIEELSDFLWDCIIHSRPVEEELLERGRQICRKSSVAHIETKENIPIFSVTGTNGKTTTARLLYHVLSKLGYCAGIACTGEIKIGSETVEKGDTTGFLSARRVLEDKRVEAAVLETARGGILRNGLGYEKARAAIITSLSEDHFGIDDIKNLKELLKIKSVILEEISSNGKWILRAQEDIIEEAREIAARRKNDRTDERSFETIACLVSIDLSEPVKMHIEKGGEVYFLEDGCIVHVMAGKRDRLIDIRELPFTYGGISRGNIINVMCVLAAISTIEQDTVKVLDIIKDIPCDIEHNPGRQNILELGKVKILIDYGHNPEAYEFIYSMVRSLRSSRVTSIITVAGDRNDRHIELLGYMAGRESDKIIIREQKDQRGSAKGRVASLMEKGVISSGLDISDIKFIENAEEALIYALEEAVPEEVIVIFAEEPEAVLEKLKKYAAIKGEKLQPVNS